MNTIVVNMFAGPGAGKTTCAWAIASELKKRGIETEYVSEYAKELVWDNNLELLDGSFVSQCILFKEQNKRVQRLLGKVKVVVTDSPAIMGLIYLKYPNVEFEQEVITKFKAQHNFNLFIQRGKEFQQVGRIHDLQQSRQLDAKIKRFLEDNGIYYGTYYHHTLNVLVDNIIKHSERLNDENA